MRAVYVCWCVAVRYVVPKCYLGGNLLRLDSHFRPLTCRSGIEISSRSEVEKTSGIGFF